MTTDHHCLYILAEVGPGYSNVCCYLGEILAIIFCSPFLPEKATFFALPISDRLLLSLEWVLMEFTNGKTNGCLSHVFMVWLPSCLYQCTSHVNTIPKNLKSISKVRVVMVIGCAPSPVINTQKNTCSKTWKVQIDLLRSFPKCSMCKKLKNGSCWPIAHRTVVLNPFQFSLLRWQWSFEVLPASLVGVCSWGTYLSTRPGPRRPRPTSDGRWPWKTTPRDRPYSQASFQTLLTRFHSVTRKS